MFEIPLFASFLDFEPNKGNLRVSLFRELTVISFLSPTGHGLVQSMGKNRKLLFLPSVTQACAQRQTIADSRVLISCQSNISMKSTGLSYLLPTQTSSWTSAVLLHALLSEYRIHTMDTTFQSKLIRQLLHNRQALLPAFMKPQQIINIKNLKYRLKNSSFVNFAVTVRSNTEFHQMRFVSSITFCRSPVLLVESFNSDFLLRDTLQI